MARTGLVISFQFFKQFFYSTDPMSSMAASVMRGDTIKAIAPFVKREQQTCGRLAILCLHLRRLRRIRHLRPSSSSRLRLRRLSYRLNSSRCGPGNTSCGRWKRIGVPTRSCSA